ncbi:MAG: ATP-binding protein [Chitinispirillaceae bacterium]|nr:ATP-binding protein [Chitinispirillaceae bacterium]
MILVPFITDKKELIESVTEAINEGLRPSDAAQVVTLTNHDKAMDYLNLEMPDLVCIDFSCTSLNPYVLLDSIMGDPWILHAGIIAFCNDPREEQRLNEMKAANIIVVMRYGEIERTLPKMISIIYSNRRILFQRVIGMDLQDTISASFQLDNDVHEASCYANLVANYLHNTNKIDQDGKNSIAVSLYELLINAIEHGNCGISYDEKSAWMEKGGEMIELIRKRCEDPAIGKRKVTFDYTIDPGSSKYVITDEGNGFNWNATPDPTEGANIELPHGRGILMARAFTNELAYNEKGNSVRFGLEHLNKGTLITPAIFKSIEPTDVKRGAIVLREGEESDFLCYIIRGTYDIIVNDKKVSALSEDDIFLGEMSFLLNNRRTATVKATTDGRLIKVSKREFVDAIKKKPHYALMLARLLAQRIHRNNMVSAKG